MHGAAGLTCGQRWSRTIWFSGACSAASRAGRIGAACGQSITCNKVLRCRTLRAIRFVTERAQILNEINTGIK